MAQVGEPSLTSFIQSSNTISKSPCEEAFATSMASAPEMSERSVSDGRPRLVGFAWAMLFNAGLGAQLGVFAYGRVIPGLAIFEGTKEQYPIYDALAMALQMMAFAYLLGRTDDQGRNVIEIWSDSRTASRMLQRPTLMERSRCSSEPAARSSRHRCICKPAARNCARRS